MRTSTSHLNAWLGGAVLAHFGICLVHGAAHSGAGVPLPLPATVFVFGVILAGPVVGLVLRVWQPRAGAWTIAATLAAALVFGLINHFLLRGPDHVAHVAAEWRAMFGATAILLVISEAFGAGVAVWSAVRAGRS